MYGPSRGVLDLEFFRPNTNEIDSKIHEAKILIGLEGHQDDFKEIVILYTSGGGRGKLRHVDEVRQGRARHEPWVLRSRLFGKGVQCHIA